MTSVPRESDRDDPENDGPEAGAAENAAETGAAERGNGGARMDGASLQSWQQPRGSVAEQMTDNALVDVGWGRLIFAHTFPTIESLVETLAAEPVGKRDIAFYLRDPHVVLATAPDRLFLDPSHTYRIWMEDYQSGQGPEPEFRIREIRTRADSEAVNRIYASWRMVTCAPAAMLEINESPVVTLLIAEGTDGQVLGTVMGVDHVEAFNDPESGSSLWCLAADAQADVPGVGEALVRHLVEYYQAKGREYLDLSVMHDNTQAIALYYKLGFERVPVFTVKTRNPINEPLFTPARPKQDLNPYAGIIVDEARRRGITVEVLDAEAAYFALSWGGRSVVCRESLTEFTTAIAMSRCDDKRVTHRLLEAAGLQVPFQQEAGEPEDDASFMGRHESVVVKPARGEQGAGVSVDVRDEEHLRAAVEEARRHCPDVILEQFVRGDDLRVIVIDGAVVAASVRRPPVIRGTGKHTVRKLIGKYNRRRAAATGGESQIPLDAETARTAADGGYGLDDVLERGKLLQLRKTANLHTGGTMHDVTERLHPELARASVEAAHALSIPVVGLDLLVPGVEGPEYTIIEANERPGLANHEPQPTAERFIDFLFPQTVGLRSWP
jgi:GNAT-family acetyltransferase (TIGR03103 family)